jgi:hypothetical protein
VGLGPLDVLRAERLALARLHRRADGERDDLDELLFPLQFQRPSLKPRIETCGFGGMVTEQSLAGGGSLS